MVNPAKSVPQSPPKLQVGKSASRQVATPALRRSALPARLLLALLACPTIVAAPLQVRTNYHSLVLHYNPHVHKDGQYLTVHQAYSQRNIDALCNDYIQFLKRASGGQITFDVAEKFELDEFPPDRDPDVTFTSGNYDHYRSEGYDMFHHGGPDYPAICSDPRFRMIERVEAGEVDAIWIFAPDGTGFWETAMAGRDAYWVNGAAYPEVNCSKRFVLYGFGVAAHQGVGFMLENTAHMSENILGNRIASGWPASHTIQGWSTLNLNHPTRTSTTHSLNDWDYFTVSDAVHWNVRLVAPAHSQAGLSHFPPTACVNYGWSAVRLDFDSAWQASELETFGTWTINEGKLSAGESPTNRAILSGSHHLEDDLGDYRVPVIITDANISAGVCVESTDPAAQAGILFRCARYNTDSIVGYFVGIAPGQDHLFLARLDPTPTILGQHSMPLEPGVRYDLFLSLRGPSLSVATSPNAQPLITSDQLLQRSDGGVGLATHNTTAWFSHLDVTPIIPCNAEAWRTYPDLNNRPILLSPAEWRGDGQPYEDNDYWFAWWYEHLPKNPGIHLVQNPATGQPLGWTLNSWWPYLFDINVFTTPFLPTQNVVTAAADQTAPATPTTFRGTPEGPDSIRIEWQEPVDNIGVTRYEIHRDGQRLSGTPLRYFIDRPLQPHSTHTYTVRALDGSGNASQPTPPLAVSTFASGDGLLNGDCESGLSMPIRWQTTAFKPTASFTWEPAGSGRHSSRCLSIDASNELNDARWTQQLTGLEPHGRYLLEGWIKGEGVELDQGATIGANLCAIGGWEHTSPALTGTFDWTHVQCYLAADAEGQLTIGCRLGFWGNLASGHAWFDDLTLTHAPPGLSCILPWGLDPSGCSNVPDGLFNVLTIATGSSHNLALQPDGTMVAWGANWSGQCDLPRNLTNVAAIAAANSHSLALTRNGSIVGWGDNLHGQLDTPHDLTNAVAIATGSRFTLALCDTGRVTGWGGNDWGELNIPPDLDRVVAIAAGHEFALALRDNGTLVAWGSFQSDDDFVYPAYVPEGLNQVVAVACGTYHALALNANGTVVAWGENESGQTNVPTQLSRVIAIAAGAFHSLAMTAEGGVVAWGSNGFGESAVPPIPHFAYSIHGASQRSLALIGNKPPTFNAIPISMAAHQNTFSVTIAPQRGQACFLQATDSLNSPDWNLLSSLLALDPTATLSDSSAAPPHRFYRVRITP